MNSAFTLRNISAKTDLHGSLGAISCYCATHATAAMRLFLINSRIFNYICNCRSAIVAQFHCKFIFCAYNCNCIIVGVEK